MILFGFDHHKNHSPWEGAPHWAVELRCMLSAIIKNQENEMIDVSALQAVATRLQASDTAALAALKSADAESHAFAGRRLKRYRASNRAAHHPARILLFITSEIVMLKSTALAVALLCVPLIAHAETGRASHYGHGDGFNGRRTANGERFDKMGMTAAHRTRTMGSRVTVTNLANGRSVLVRINDRGPAKWTGKIIDLSYGASRAIGMVGTARVSVQ